MPNFSVPATWTPGVPESSQIPIYPIPPRRDDTFVPGTWYPPALRIALGICNGSVANSSIGSLTFFLATYPQCMGNGNLGGNYNASLKGLPTCIGAGGVTLVASVTGP